MVISLSTSIVPQWQVDPSNSDSYSTLMSTKELVAEAIALPLSERISLAQILWQSIDTDVTEADDQNSMRNAIRRDRELESGEVIGRTHEEVMEAARKAIGCA